MATPARAPEPHVLILGGGFAGLRAARALRRAPARVTLVDRRNHHVFQPLLYQVATAALSPADIAAPIRRVLRRQANCRVVLGEASGVDLARRRVLFPDAALSYDWLVLATGATHSYFGHPEWAPLAPGLKTLEDATEIRRRILLAFESAEVETSAAARRAALTFAVVGGGPTGVELAGAIAEIAARTIPRDFRAIDTRTTRVLLLEAGPRLLAAFDARLAERARADLEALGVEVRLGALVTEVTAEGVRIGSERVAARNVLWAAGVQASPLARSLDVPLDRAGRVLVEPDLSVPGHPEVLVAGDLAAVRWEGRGAHAPWVPGVAPAAMQAGAHAGRLLARELVARAAGAPPPPRAPFRYRDKGSLATIGRARAVAQIGRWRTSGLLAWCLWSAVHVFFLIDFKNRVVVLLSWAWNWLVAGRGARLILGDARVPLADEAEADRERL